MLTADWIDLAYKGVLGVVSVYAAVRASQAKTASQSVEIKVDGRLSELIAALEAKNVIDKKLSFSQGADQERRIQTGTLA